MPEETHKYYVWWQSLFNLYSQGTYPRVPPFLTRDQAEDEVRKEMAKGYVRAAVREVVRSDA